MVHLFRLIAAALLLCLGSPAMADGGPFPAIPGQWDTSTCNESRYPLGDVGEGVTAQWSCKSGANPNMRSCGYTYNNGYYSSMCNQQKAPDSCPSGSTMSTSGSGASVCTCEAGLVPFDGGCRPKPQCSPGSHDDGTGRCVPNDCNPDETRVGERCIKDPPCPPGQTRIGKHCKPNKCKAGASAGDYTDLSDSVTYLCEMSNGLNCQVRIKPTICVKLDGLESCSGEGTFTGATCSGGNGGTGGGTGNGDGGNPDGNPGTGGTGTGGTGTGGTGTGGTGTGGTGTGGGGTGTGGTGTGGTGTGGTGTGGTGTGGTGTGDGGTGTGGTGTGGTGTGGTGSGTGGQTFPPVIPIPPAPDGKCPSGTHKVGDICIKNPESPDGDGKCPEGSIKINGKCVYSEPPTGGGTGTGGGGTGSGDGDGDGEESGFGGTCMAGFACDGDAIQCAIAKEQYARNCKLFDDTSAESDLYNANKGKTGNQTGDLPGNETISLTGRIDTSDPLGGGGCFGDLSVTVWGTSVSLPLSNLCQYLAMLGNILVAVSMLMAARIVTRG